MIRSGLALGLAGCVSPAALASPVARFPEGFVWGASTSGHQVEGNDTASDTWFLANIKPSVFREPVGDAANSFELWEQDLDLCVSMGLGAYRFSIEWSRIEPEPGQYSQAMLDHYKRMIEGCRERRLKPICTLNHFTSPRWFSADRGWLGDGASEKFAAYCALVTRQMGDGIDTALTFNEPNLPKIIGILNLPPQIRQLERAMLERAAELSGGTKFVATNVVLEDDLEALEEAMLVGHRDARAAIKAERGDLPVGISLAIIDDQAAQGGEAKRDAMREHLYNAWLREARKDDFLGVQNYERHVWSSEGFLPAPEGTPRNFMGSEVYAASLTGAVRYAYSQAQVPIFVTEHGVGTDDDAIRSALIPDALRYLQQAMADGVPVKGYCHWSLLDNFEWIFGYGPTFGLASVDRSTFQRRLKPSAAVYEAIVRANAI